MNTSITRKQFYLEPARIFASLIVLLLIGLGLFQGVKDREIRTYLMLGVLAGGVISYGVGCEKRFRLSQSLDEVQ